MGYRRIIMNFFSETHLHQCYSNLYDMNRNQMERKPQKIKIGPCRDDF